MSEAPICDTIILQAIVKLLGIRTFQLQGVQSGVCEGSEAPESYQYTEAREQCGPRGIAPDTQAPHRLHSRGRSSERMRCPTLEKGTLQTGTLRACAQTEL